MTSESHPTLFAEESDREGAGEPPVKAQARSAARVLQPNRVPIELRPCDLESLLPEGHRARIAWAYYVEQADLSPLYARIKAVAGGSGRAAIAPEILLALWLYATVEGVGSARAIARLTQAHDAYCWLCGGVQVNYHTLLARPSGGLSMGAPRELRQELNVRNAYAEPLGLKTTHFFHDDEREFGTCGSSGEARLESASNTLGTRLVTAPLSA